MKVLGCILGALALVTVVGGVLALATGFPSSNNSQSPTMAADSGASTSTSMDDPRATTGEAPGGTPEDATSASGTASAVVPGPSATPFVSEVAVGQPALELATFPLASVEATYTESHQFGRVTVRFRPGAYSAEYAAEIASQADAAIAEANAKLQQQWTGDLTVFLADQLFAEDCLGCQGFTESDFRWIFMLDDGSVVPEEFQALLVHESAHLIAGNTIHLPFEIFYVEGLATWVMTDDLIDNGYLPPLQSTAWVYEAGALPSLQEIMNDDFAGRMRKRVYYDAAASFAFFIIDTYGWDAYVSLYRQNSLDVVLGKSITEVEAEWHGYLESYVGQTVNGVGAVDWWDAASQVIDGFGRFYEDPSSYSADQYEALTLSRMALNRADPGNALAYLAQSGI